MSGCRTSNIRVTSTNAPGSSLCEVMEKNTMTALALSTRFADCEICNSIWKALTNLLSEGTTSYISLGYFNEALSPKCLTRRPMLEWIQRYYRVLHSRDVKYHRVSNTVRGSNAIGHSDTIGQLPNFHSVNQVSSICENTEAAFAPTFYSYGRTLKRTMLESRESWTPSGLILASWTTGGNDVCHPMENGAKILPESGEYVRPGSSIRRTHV